MRTRIAIFMDFVPWLGGHVVLGTHYDLRGEPYLATYSIVDIKDLVMKLRELAKEDLISLGFANRRKALERILKNEETFKVICRKIYEALGNR